MNVSNIKLKPSTERQKHTYTKVLLAMLDNKQLWNSTSKKKLADRLNIDTMKPNSIRMTLIRMEELGIITKVGTKQRANYSINYYHPMVTEEVIEKAPEDIKEEMKNRKANLEPGQYIDAYGCITTAVGTKEKELSSTPDDKEDTPTSQQMSVPLTADFDGKSLNITINLNIKLSN